MKRTEHYLKEVAIRTGAFYKLTEEEEKKLKQAFLDIYSDIYAVCKKYDLQVMLFAGSALGAVRHKGYIPWDNDFDLTMAYEDLEKFQKVFQEELGDRYIISAPCDGQPESKTLFTKIFKKGTKIVTADEVNRLDLQGISIDIYPIVRMPDNKLWRTIKCRLLDLIRILAISVSIYETKNSLFKQAFQSSFVDRAYYRIRWTIGLVCSIYGKRNWYDLHSKFSSSSKGTKWCTVPTCCLAIEELQPRAVFFPPKRAEFEGLEVYLPNDVNKYLTSIYGDYMTPPPVEERTGHFYLEKPVFDKD